VWASAAITRGRTTVALVVTVLVTVLASVEPTDGENPHDRDTFFG
jgi:hypothetical protein